MKLKMVIDEEERSKKKGYGLDAYYEEEREEQTEKRKKSGKKKKSRKQKLFFWIKVFLIVFIIGMIGIFLFFKTSLFQKYKEIWVQTAMTTMRHQYLATWFLSEEEIAEIMKKLEVENNENSDSNNIHVAEGSKKDNKIKVEKITGKGYVGFVMIVPDASKVKLVDGRLSRKRF